MEMQAALWGHYTIFGANSRETSVSTIIGPAMAAASYSMAACVKGKKTGFWRELGHVLLPYQSIAGLDGMKPNAIADAQGTWSRFVLSPRSKGICCIFFAAVPRPRSGKMTAIRQPSKYEVSRTRVMGCARRFSVFRPDALGLFFGRMVNTFDPDAVNRRRGRPGGEPEVSAVVLEQIRVSMPAQREEQASVPFTLCRMAIQLGREGGYLKR